MKIKTDLHLHTQASDGCWTGMELIDVLRANDIELFAITDHDSVKTAQEVRTDLLPKGLRFIMGVEFSSFERGICWHILGYGFDPEYSALGNLISRNQAASAVWFDEIVQYTCRENHGLSFDEYKNYRYEPSRGGFEAINYLLDKDVIDKPSGFSQLAQTSGAVPGFPRVIDVVEVIKKAGGYAVLAHPSKYGGNTAMAEEELMAFLNKGIDGIECYHPSVSLRESEKYAAFCRKNNLMITGGSDCHGSFLPQRRVGYPEIFEAMLVLDRLEY